MRDWRGYVRERLGLTETRRGGEESAVEELAAALEDLYGEARDRGLSSEEADAYARERVADWDALVAELVKHRRVEPVPRLNGWLERSAQRARARGGAWSWPADMGRDLRYTWRTLRRSPGFAAIALLTLALGIGAVTAVFSLANGVLLSPLPYERPEQLVYMWEKLVSFENASVSYPNFLDWRQRNRVFEDLAGFNDAGINLTGVGMPEELGMVRVSASMFPILEVQPALGRNFLPEEDRVGAPGVVLLTHGFWQRRFGGDPGIVGSVLSLDGLPYTVVGVMPRDFVFPPGGERVDLYAPIGQFAENWIESRGDHPGIAVIGRLRDDATIEAAREDMERIALELEAEYPDTNTGARAHVVSLHARMVRNLHEPMTLLLVAVGLLLLIACTNVANLVLARGTARQREIAIRSSLGAHGGRIVRLLLTENVALWLAGGALGVIAANFALPALTALRPDELAPIFDVGIDVRVVLVAAVIALLTGLLFGLVPALRSIRPDLVEHLKEGSRSSGGVGRNRLRSALVIAEVGLAVALLIAAGLTVRSFVAMVRESPGVDTENVLAVDVALPESRYGEGEQRAAFFRELLDRARALPGVRSAATTFIPPLASAGWQMSFHVEGDPPEEGGAANFAELSSVSPDYFQTMGIPLIQGRDFEWLDGWGDRPPVVIIDEVMAERFWPNEDPIGKRLKFGRYDSDNPWMEVVGVVGHVRLDGVVEESLQQFYIPHLQDNDFGYFLMVKTVGDPTHLVEPIRRAVLGIAPNQPLGDVSTMQEFLRETTEDGRFMAVLLGIFAATALILAAVGIYGVVAQATAERRHEIGVRIAVGATDAGVLRLVVRQGMARVLVGVILGLLLAAIFSRLMDALLFGVSPLDPATFLLAPAFITGVALAASVIPARRALKVDPVRALQAQ